jgi:glycolate oxidase FAD binding subunit
VTKVVTSLTDVLPAEAIARDTGATGPWPGLAPEAVVHPETTEEVAAAVAWAAAEGLGVLPVASGRRLDARPPERPYLLLRTDRLTGIEIYEPADLTLTAKAGTPLADLRTWLDAHRQWLPFDPPRVDERSLGGLVASGESGPMWMGYGELRNHVLGMTVVTGDGRTLRLGGRVVKNVAGFDLLKPMVGSRGRLAAITSVCVRTFPVPAEDRLLVLRAQRAAELCEAARAVGTAPVLPVSCVLMAPARALGAGATLLVRLHGSPPTVDADQRTLERHCGVTFERPVETDAIQAIQVEARDLASEGPVLVVATLPSHLPEALAAVAAVTEVEGAAAGEVELVADTYLGCIRVAAQAIDRSAVDALRREVERLGGSLTVHSGSPVGSVGRSARSAADGASDTVGLDGLRLASFSTSAQRELVAGLERVFDPGGVLWPCRV